MQRRILLSLVVSILTAASLFAGGQAESAEGEGSYKFGATVMDLANPYFVTLVEGMKDRATELGIELTVHDGKSDAAAQVTAIETYIAQGMDAVIAAPIDPNALEHMVDTAHEAGIPFINPTQVIPGNDANINLSDFDYGYTGGKIAGEWIVNELGGEATVAILGHPEMEALIKRAEGIEAAIEELAPNAEIVSLQSAHTPERGMSATETILQAHPDVKVIACINDAGALGAMEAVKAMGLATEDFGVFGLDATAEAIDAIKNDTIFRGTVDIDPYGTGALVIDTTIDVINNGPKEEMVLIPMKPVTSANIDQY